jgi:transposase
VPTISVPGLDQDGLEVGPISRTLPTERKSPKCPNQNLPTRKPFATKWSNWSAAVASPNELAKEFVCHTTSILSWVRHAGGAGATTLPANVAALNAQERQELIELRQLQMERDILAKATAWLAGQSEKTFTPSTNS